MKDNNEIGKDCKVFTLTFKENWFDNNIFVEKYRIISEVIKTEDGFEYNVESVDN